MKKRTVRQRIFLSNTAMVLVALVLFLLINAAVIKLYSEVVEQELVISAEGIYDEEELEELIKSYTVKRNTFLILFCCDGILCIGVLLFISQLFTKRLTRQILEPIEALQEGALRVQKGDLSTAIVYSGDVEFVQVCEAFNEMQRHLLEEEEKNRHYEKARTDMIAGISHDLRTPLSAITGTIKGLLDGVAATEESRRRFLETAYRRAGEMDGLLNQLFLFSKLETGNMPLAIEPVEIAAFIEQYAAEKEPVTAQTNGITAQVAADPLQLLRVLDNLVENSVKYAHADPLCVTISLTRAPDAVKLCVADNGAGVPSAELSHLFEEFYRVDRSRGQKEGNGLGLYIVRYLIEAMHGCVWAENRDGLAVWLQLPLAGKGETEHDG